MQLTTLELRTEHTTLIITLNRPDKLNAISSTMLDELERVFRNESLIASHRTIVITGSGKAFAAGADIAELARCTAETGTAFSQRGQKMFALIEECPIPVIAAVNGYALGGGCELAMACHLRFAARTARFGQPEVKLGIIPGYGGTQRLVRLIGVGRALELLLSGEHITAEQAFQWGLVNRLTEPETLMDEVLTFSSQLGKLPPLALRAVLRCAYAASAAPDYDLEAHHFGVLCGTDDFREGTTAFLEKRTPTFRGA